MYCTMNCSEKPYVPRSVNEAARQMFKQAAAGEQPVFNTLLPIQVVLAIIGMYCNTSIMTKGH